MYSSYRYLVFQVIGRLRTFSIRKVSKLQIKDKEEIQNLAYG